MDYLQFDELGGIGKIHVLPEEIRAIKSVGIGITVDRRTHHGELLIGGRWIAVKQPLPDVLAAIAEATKPAPKAA